MTGAIAEPVAARRQRPFGTVFLTRPVRRPCRNAGYISGGIAARAVMTFGANLE